VIALLVEPRRVTHLDTEEQLLVWGSDEGRFFVQDGEGAFRWEDHSLIVSSYRFDPDRETSGVDGWHDVPDFSGAAPVADTEDELG